MPESSDLGATSDGDREPPPTRYAIRLSVRAGRDRAEAAAWIIEIVGEDVAREWLAGLAVAIASLSDQPKRNAVAPRESRLIGQDVRRHLYRRTPGSAAYHVLYLIEEDSDDAGDGPRVIVFHIRHAARKPLTAREARDLRQGARGDL